MAEFLSTPSARRATSPAPKINARTMNFYPRPPRGGRLQHDTGIDLHGLISIHALREEGDYLLFSTVPGCIHFYPRPPRGGRQFPVIQSSSGMDFYPRPPRGGRPTGSVRPVGTADFYPRPPRGGRPIVEPDRRGAPNISIHALREEGDSAWVASTSGRSNFYPRPPRGGRPERRCRETAIERFLSTPSARRATPHGPKR